MILHIYLFVDPEAKQNLTYILIFNCYDLELCAWQNISLVELPLPRPEAGEEKFISTSSFSTAPPNETQTNFPAAKKKQEDPQNNSLGTKKKKSST